MSLQTTAQVTLHPANELVAVLIGRGLTDKDTPAQDKAELEEFLGKFEKVDVVYKQNTADTVNIAIPVYPEVDRIMREMQLTDEQLQSISGGESVIIGLVLTVLGLIGAKVAAIFTAKAIGATAAVAIGVSVVVGTTVGIAGVTAGVGVGIAAGVGAFDSDSDVNVVHAS